jgi:hypothetical protein
LRLNAVSERNFYSVVVAAHPNGMALDRAFLATATALAAAGQIDDTTCRSLTVDHTGTRGAVSAGGAATNDQCWR